LEQIDLAPGRLSAILRGARSGIHPLFDLDSIREAFSGPEIAVTRDNAGELGRTLLAVARDPREAPDLLARLPARTRALFIRVYFRLLDRAAPRPTLH
jgi:hypothetical protein